MNFKILSVNGRDLSGVSQHEAARVFQSAVQPMTVVISHTKCDDNGNRPSFPSSLDFDKTVTVDCSTQTDVRQCCCNGNVTRLTKSFSFQNNNHFEESPSVFSSSVSNSSFQNNFIHPMVLYEEIILKRPQNGDKLGITLSDLFDSSINATSVVITNIASGSDAEKCQELSEGDTIIKINDSFVSNMNEAAELLNADLPTVSFVVARQQSAKQKKTARNIKMGSRCKARSTRTNSVVGNDQISLPNRIRCSSDGDSPRLESNGSDVCGKSFAKAAEQSCKAPKNRILRKSVSFSQNVLSCPTNDDRSPPEVAKNSKPKSLLTEMQRLCEEVKTFKVDRDDNLFSPNGTMKGFSLHESPWLQIARQDYQNVLKQLQKDEENDDNLPSLNSNNKTSPSADNTSSAYSTGESFRSLGSANESILTENLVSLPRSKHNFVPGHKHRSSCTSSDANSDNEAPACYLTHIEDGSESEGFQDAGTEFSSSFSRHDTTSKNPNSVSQTFISENPEILFHSSTSGSHDINRKYSFSCNRTESFTSDSKRGKPEGTNRKETKNSRFDIIPVSNKVKFSTENTEKFSSKRTSKYRESNLCLKDRDCSYKTDRLQRQKSEVAFPVERPKPTQRSMSCVETGVVSTEEESGAGEIPMEWKVRVRSDGSRYITKRPVQQRKQSTAEDGSAAFSSDVDDQSDFMLGRRCSRDERKRQYRVAREKKRRRDYMQRRRLEATGESPMTGSDLTELGVKKMSKQRQKRMLLDDFVTVQELLAHGNRTDDVAKLNPMLSITYI